MAWSLGCLCSYQVSWKSVPLFTSYWGDRKPHWFHNLIFPYISTEIRAMNGMLAEYRHTVKILLLRPCDWRAGFEPGTRKRKWQMRLLLVLLGCLECRRCCSAWPLLHHASHKFSHEVSVVFTGALRICFLNRKIGTARKHCSVETRQLSFNYVLSFRCLGYTTFRELDVFWWWKQ